MEILQIDILVDDPKSWILPFAQQLCERLVQVGHKARFFPTAAQLEGGDVLFALGCSKILGLVYLGKYGITLVVHESDLPDGRGWSPLKWQIEQGKNRIPIVLFEATEGLDEGPIYIKEEMVFEGHELIDELRSVQGEMTVSMCLRYVNERDILKPRPQSGEGSFFRRREFEDSRLNPELSIAEQFNAFRVTENSRFPLFCDFRGHRYKILIEKDDEYESQD